MRTVFLDTNVVLYAATARSSDPHRHAIGEDVMARQPFRVSAQVLAEFASVSMRKALLPPAVLDLWLARLMETDPQPLDGSLVRAGLAMARTHRLNYYDGAILAAAERTGCDVVLSEDMSDGRSYGAVTVRNPFRDAV